MAVDAASILAVVQVARIANEIFAEYTKGTLTDEQMAQSWAEIRSKSKSARERWEAAKAARAGKPEGTA